MQIYKYTIYKCTKGFCSLAPYPITNNVFAKTIFLEREEGSDDEEFYTEIEIEVEIEEAEPF